MDALSILSTVLSTAIALNRWVGNLKSKENAIRELESSLSSITLVLHPLRQKAAGGALNSQVGILACLQDLGECLNTAREHLQAWQESETRKAGPLVRRIFAFLDPSQVIGAVKEDSVRLNQTITVLTLAIQLAWSPGLQSTTSPLDFITNSEAKAFWRQMIGTDTLCCPMNDFRVALNTWLGGSIAIPDNLLLQLDEQEGYGGVTPSRFSRFVGSQSITQAISKYINPIVVPMEQAVDRLIIWVAENSENCRAGMEYAESLGIKVIPFSSLAAMKSWMQLNRQFILACATSHRLRFISDSARNEGGNFNPAAGELLLRFLRGHLILAPCLIFAPAVDTTAYVAAYERAGSTTDLEILRGYIKALAEGIRDFEWVGFDVRSGAIQQSLGNVPHPEDQGSIHSLVIYVGGTKPEQDQVNIGYAVSLGITVVSLLSTDELRRYVEANNDQLRRVEAAHRLRFMIQNVRRHGDVVEFNAGEDALKCVRTRGFTAPVLVLCTSSIATTRFVTLYERAGSTTDSQVARKYLEALAAGVRDTELGENWWVGFDARWGVPPASQIGTSPQNQWFIRPLLIYVAGTRPEQDQMHIDYAASLGITVVSLFSTDELKRYVRANQDQLHRMGAAHRLRFMTQNVRRHGDVVDLSAGEETLKYVRTQGFVAPILVLCASSVATTRFVELYQRAGSTTCVKVTRGYIEALAAGVRDTEWVGYDRKV
ncbi:hypothetical protein K438DRAFT_1953010 [Mycena galopus ATCC 62051]|nr:hypothetical protein K438DRAFT_1953010 [Mycena galopus ATCC 62051]